MVEALDAVLAPLRLAGSSSKRMSATPKASSEPGLAAPFLLRRAEGLVEMGLGQFGGSAVQSSLACHTD